MKKSIYNTNSSYSLIEVLMSLNELNVISDTISYTSVTHNQLHNQLPNHTVPRLASLGVCGGGGGDFIAL